MGSFYSIESFHGTILLAQAASGYIENGLSDTIGTVPVIAYADGARPRRAFLAADLAKDMTLKLHPMQTVGRIVPVGVTSDANGEILTFYSPWNRRFLVVAPPSGPGATAHAVLVTEEPNEYEELRFRSVSEDGIPPILLDARPYLDILTGAGCTAQSVIGILRSIDDSSLARDIMSAAGLSLSLDELEVLTQHLVAHPADLERLISHYPDDLAARYALKPLISWIRRKTPTTPRVEAPGTVERKRRRRVLDWLRKPSRPAISSEDRANELLFQPTRVGVIGPEFDMLDTLGRGGDFVSLPHACNILARQRTRPDKRACILATARNEGLYILDWLSYHRGLGFEDFFIYSNDNTDGSDHLLKALAEAGEIVWVRNVVGPARRPQWKAYNHALQIVPDILAFEWTLAIDLDELFSLNPKYFETIEEYLIWAGRNSVDAIAFNWIFADCNREVLWRDVPFKMRFPIDRSNINHHIKTMFRTRLFPVSMPHQPVAFGERDFDFRAASMKPFVLDPSLPGRSVNLDAKFAWIAHYFFKSNEEFLFKLSRPRGDDLSGDAQEFAPGATDFIRHFMSQQSHFIHPQGEDLFDRAAAAHRSRLLAMPAVARAWAEIRVFYNRQRDVLLAKASGHEAFLNAGEDGRIFLRQIADAARLAN